MPVYTEEQKRLMRVEAYCKGFAEVLDVFFAGFTGLTADRNRAEIAAAERWKALRHLTTAFPTSNDVAKQEAVAEARVRYAVCDIDNPDTHQRLRREGFVDGWMARHERWRDWPASPDPADGEPPRPMRCIP